MVEADHPGYASRARAGYRERHGAGGRTSRVRVVTLAHAM